MDRGRPTIGRGPSTGLRATGSGIRGKNGDRMNPRTRFNAGLIQECQTQDARDIAFSSIAMAYEIVSGWSLNNSKSILFSFRTITRSIRHTRLRSLLSLCRADQQISSVRSLMGVTSEMSCPVF